MIHGSCIQQRNSSQIVEKELGYRRVDSTNINEVVVYKNHFGIIAGDRIYIHTTIGCKINNTYGNFHHDYVVVNMTP